MIPFSIQISASFSSHESLDIAGHPGPSV